MKRRHRLQSNPGGPAVLLTEDLLRYSQQSDRRLQAQTRLRCGGRIDLVEDDDEDIVP
jgi:hypothetical protein